MSCERCSDTMWVVGDDGFARRCGCFDRIVVRQLVDRSEIPTRHLTSRLDTFDDTVHESAREALNAAADVVAGFPNVRGLFLSGPPGTGKTHLAAAVLRELIETRQAFGIFVSWNTLLERLRSTYDDGDVRSADVTDPVVRAKVLVVDELGARRVTEWSHDTLTWLVGVRYDDAKVTIITSNYAGEELVARIGVRLCSRIAEMCIHVPIEGYDYRLRKVAS